jgi:hypothetical protein
MSITWMGAVWDQAKDVKGTSLLVLLCVADHANEEGLCFPSVERIARRCRIGTRATYATLAKLEERGWLSRESRPGHSTLYRVHVPTGVHDGAPCTDVPKGVHDGAPITVRTTNKEPDVVEEEVSTGRVHEPAQPPPPEIPVTESTFPKFARAALKDHTTQEKNDWISAWETVDSIAKAWEPTMHLTKYLADRKRNERRPVAEEWVKWFVQDEHQAQAEAAAPAEDERDSRPWYE